MYNCLPAKFTQYHFRLHFRVGTLVLHRKSHLCSVGRVEHRGWRIDSLWCGSIWVTYIHAVINTSGLWGLDLADGGRVIAREGRLWLNTLICLCFAASTKTAMSLLRQIGKRHIEIATYWWVSYKSETQGRVCLKERVGRSLRNVRTCLRNDTTLSQKTVIFREELSFQGTFFGNIWSSWKSWIFIFYRLEGSTPICPILWRKI